MFPSRRVVQKCAKKRTATITEVELSPPQRLLLVNTGERKKWERPKRLFPRRVEERGS